MEKNCKPHIITYHNDVVVPARVDGRHIPDFTSRWIEYKNEELVKPVLDKADVIIATTRSYAETSPILKEYLGKIEIVPNAIHVDNYTPGVDAGERDKIILYVGRLVEYKGLNTLIKASRAIDAKVIVIGDGEDRNRFEVFSRKLGVNIEFKGRVSFEELREWIKKARILVLPSKSRLEAFGIVLLEAMACKTPVIASKIPGVEEIARNGGYVFEEEEELTLYISELLENDNIATKLGRRGRNKVIQEYDWNNILNKIQRIYRCCT
jgi:glycosyltransferase involved in cell wall biosynthesis